MIRFKENNCTANMKQNLLLGKGFARTIVNMFIFKFFAKVGT